MEEEKKEKGFVIKDRRHFDESGTTREEPEPEADRQKPADGPADARDARTEKGPADAEEAGLPEMNFAGFVLSLSTTAMFHFGDFPDPVTREAKRNLVAAKQTIDILNILETKTKGNLDEDEKQLLEGILYELRMRYVKEMSSK